MDDQTTTSSEMPAAPPFSSPAADMHSSLSTPDRNSAIALGIILFVIICTILYALYRCHVRRRLEAQLDADLSSDLPASSQARDTYHHLRGSRLMSQSMFSSNSRRVSSWCESTLHNPSLSSFDSRGRNPSQAALHAVRERHWWGSVARHGSTSVADKKISAPIPMQNLGPAPLSTLSSVSGRRVESCPRCGLAPDSKKRNNESETLETKEKADVRFGRVKWGGEVKPVWCNGVSRKTSITVEEKDRNKEEKGPKWMEPVVTARSRKDSGVKRVGGVERRDWNGGWI